MSAIVTIVGRLGRDVVLRHTPQNTAVANIAIATDFQNSKREKVTQWWDLSLFGKQAESLEQWLKKGSVFQVSAKDVHISTYAGNDGVERSKLTGVVVDISFVPKQSETPAEQKQAPRQSNKNNGDDLASDIPF